MILFLLVFKLKKESKKGEKHFIWIVTILKTLFRIFTSIFVNKTFYPQEPNRSTKTFILFALLSLLFLLL